MYQVRIIKTIWADDEFDDSPPTVDVSRLIEKYPDCANVEYQISLSFVPSLGMEIHDNTDTQAFRSGPLAKITWSNDTQEFWCYVEDEHPYQSGGYSYSYSWLLNQALVNGWKVIETGSK